MYFSYRWLRELSGTRKSPEKLAALLMTHAFEVESVVPYAHGLSSVVVGKVLAVKPHPNADRLQVATVSTGRKALHEIVCGAPNLARGQKVAVALVGARLPGGIEIKAAELRGVQSAGMLCSAKELGLGGEHTGILVLPDDAPIGRDFALYAGLVDTVLDVKILPDRSCDALSYRGLAREIAALEGGIAAYCSAEKKSPRIRRSPRVPKVVIKTDRSKRYLALLLEPVTMGQSPLMVQVRLVLSGQRPVNTFVDLTNYLMLETGQPVHAFDADAIPKGGIVVREARSRERLTLLDGTSITLSKDDLVLADTKKPLALAGVMGGKHSAITEKTKRVLFEIASFDAQSIRRTEKRHRLLTDAAYRYERGVDRDRPIEAAILLAQAVSAWGIKGTLAIRDVVAKSAKPLKSLTIILELASLESLLGIKIPLFQAVQFCSWLGLAVKKIPNRSALKVVVPLHRPDLRAPEDLIEEIGRLYGYQRIESQPLCLPVVPSRRDPAKAFERTMKTTLAAMGFDEILAYSFYSEKNLSLVPLPQAEHLALANPMNPDQAYLRASLFPGLSLAVAVNAKQYDRFSLFEWGRVYRRGDDGPFEEKQVALVTFGPGGDSDTESFLQFKSRLQVLFDTLRVEVIWNEMAIGEPKMFHPGRVAHLTTRSGEHLGFAGEISPEASRRFAVGGSKAYFSELSVQVLLNAAQTELSYREFSRFPRAHRDISLIGPKTVSYADLETVLTSAGAPLLVAAELFDVYETGEEKSFAFHLSFGSADRTLSGDEMDAVFQRIVAMSEERLGFRLKM